MNVIDNTEEKRYEAMVEGAMIRIDYIKTRDKVYLTHTEVPASLEGQGYASRLVNRVLVMVRESSLALVPLCPFVASYFKRHPEWAELLAPGYSV